MSTPIVPPASFYRYECKQSVSTTVEKYGYRVGSQGRVITRRGIEGCPQYLVKLDGKAGPCHFEEDELARLKCCTCKKEMDTTDPLTLNCGGECVRCMAAGGDPCCIKYCNNHKP